MEDGFIFQNSIQMCSIGKTIYDRTTFVRVVPLCEINNTAKYKTIRLSLEEHPPNRKGNAMSLYMNMDIGTIFQNPILRCNGNTIHSLVIFSRVV